jgi:hypothetical protein
MSDDQANPRDRARLLRHLGQAGAFATASPLGCGRIALFRSDGGTSLGAGYVPAAAADALIADGLAEWNGTGRTRRLAATPKTAPSSRTTPNPALASRVMIVDGIEQTVLVDERESPLLWLHRRLGKDGEPQISAAQFAAGERFRSDLTLAQMLPRTTMNWDASLAPGMRDVGPRDPGSASDSALSARQRVRRACDRLGPELSGLAIDVCGFLKGLDQVERERGWPARSAKIVLRLALSALVTQYGIDPEPRPGRRHGAWRSADARPVIPPAAARG